MIHSLNIGGTERMVFHMSRALKNDFEIGLICLDKKGLMWEQCEKEGFYLGFVSRSGGLSLRNIFRFFKVVRDFAPDIIHAHQYTPFVYSVIYKILLEQKINLIFTEHGRHYPDVVSSKRYFINKLFFKFVNYVTGVSKFTNKSLKEKEGYTQDISLIYNGIYLDEIREVKFKSIREELCITSDLKLIACVGTLRQVKNPFFLLDAFDGYFKTNPQSVLVFIGDGPLRGELEQRVRQKRLEKSVFIAGERNPATAYYKDIDLFVLPSFSEAASLAILEAMYFEVPVIVSDRGGNPELITDNKTGLVVECGNVNALSDAIEKILADEAFTSKLTTCAKKEVEEKFMFDEMLNSYKEIYEK